MAKFIDGIFKTIFEPVGDLLNIFRTRGASGSGSNAPVKSISSQQSREQREALQRLERERVEKEERVKLQRQEIERQERETREEREKLQTTDSSDQSLETSGDIVTERPSKKKIRQIWDRQTLCFSLEAPTVGVFADNNLADGYSTFVYCQPRAISSEDLTIHCLEDLEKDIPTDYIYELFSLYKKTKDEILYEKTSSGIKCRGDYIVGAIPLIYLENVDSVTDFVKSKKYKMYEYGPIKFATSTGEQNEVRIFVKRDGLQDTVGNPEYWESFERAICAAYTFGLVKPVIYNNDIAEIFNYHIRELKGKGILKTFVDCYYYQLLTQTSQ